MILNQGMLSSKDSASKYFRHSLRDSRERRIAIPDNLLKYAKIDKNVTIIGMIKKIELWSPKLLNEDITLPPVGDDYEDLANEINF